MTPEPVRYGLPPLTGVAKYLEAAAAIEDAIFRSFGLPPLLFRGQTVTITCERDYLACTDPAALLTWATDETLQHPPGWLSMSEGQLRLFAGACVCIAYDDSVMLSTEHPPDGWTAYQWAYRWAESDINHIDKLPASKRADLLRDIVGNPWRRLTLPMNPAWTDWYGGGGAGRVDMEEPSRFLTPPWLTPAVRRLAASIHTGNQHGDPVALLALRDELLEAGLSEERREVCKKCDGSGLQWFPDGKRRACWSCHMTQMHTKTTRGCGWVKVRDEAAVELLRHLAGEERCPGCLGDGGFQANSTWVPCELCDPGDEKTDPANIGWRKRQTPCVRGCWAIQLLRGETP